MANGNTSLLYMTITIKHIKTYIDNLLDKHYGGRIYREGDSFKQDDLLGDSGSEPAGKTQPK